MGNNFGRNVDIAINMDGVKEEISSEKEKSLGSIDPFMYIREQGITDEKMFIALIQIMIDPTVQNNLAKILERYTLQYIYNLSVVEGLNKNEICLLLNNAIANSTNTEVVDEIANRSRRAA